MKLNYELLFGMDKQMHVLSYAIISILLGVIALLLLDKKYGKSTISYIWVALVTIGIVEEYRQFFVPNRSAEFLDAIANMFGVTLGLAISLFISYMIRYRTHFPYKLFALYSILFIPLILGLVYLNERPFITLEEPFQETLRNLVAFIGL